MIRTFVIMFFFVTNSATLVVGQSPVTEIVTKERCIGTKADGAKCNRTIGNGKRYCHFHDPARPTCGFIKKNGESCKMKVKTQGQRCHNHG